MSPYTAIDNDDVLSFQFRPSKDDIKSGTRTLPSMKDLSSILRPGNLATFLLPTWQDRVMIAWICWKSRYETESLSKLPENKLPPEGNLHRRALYFLNYEVPHPTGNRA